MKKNKPLLGVLCLLMFTRYPLDATASIVRLSVENETISLSGANLSVYKTESDVPESLYRANRHYSIALNEIKKIQFLIREGDVFQVADSLAISVGALQNEETIKITRDGEARLKGKTDPETPGEDVSMIISFGPVSNKSPEETADLLSLGGGGDGDFFNSLPFPPKGGSLASASPSVPLFNILEEFFLQSDALILKKSGQIDKLFHTTEVKYPGLYTHPAYEWSQIPEQVVTVLVLTEERMDTIRTQGFTVEDLPTLHRVLSGCAFNADTLLMGLGVPHRQVKLLESQNAHHSEPLQHVLLAGLNYWLTEGKDRSIEKLQSAVRNINQMGLARSLESKLRTDVALTGLSDNKILKDNLLNPDNKARLISMLNPLAGKYLLLGLHLGFDYQILRTIESEFGTGATSENRLAVIIDMWLENKPDPTQFLRALKIIAPISLFQRLTGTFSASLSGGVAQAGEATNSQNYSEDYLLLQKVDSEKLEELLGCSARAEVFGVQLGLDPVHLETLKGNIIRNVKKGQSSSTKFMIAILDKWKSQSDVQISQLKEALEAIDLVRTSQLVDTIIQKATKK